MGSLIAGLFFLVVAAVVFFVRRGATSNPSKIGATVGVGAASLLGVVLIVASCVATVGTQDVGIKTTFGHQSANGLSNGLHFKAPWEQIHTLDDAVQTDAYASNGYNGSDQAGTAGGCISVRIARQATACVNTIIRWQIPDKNVGTLYRNYKTNDNIRDQLLHRDLQAAVNVAFANYDPLGLNAQGDSTQPSTTQLATKIDTAIQDQVGSDLTILSVTVPIFNFDPETQSRLNQLQLQVAQTRIAQQTLQTNKAQARANQVLAASVNHDPGVLESKCLDILNTAVQKGQPLPAGFSCFGPSSRASIAVK